MKVLLITTVVISLVLISSCSTTDGIRTYIQGIPQFQTVVRLHPDSTFTIHTNTHLGGVDTVAKGKWITQSGHINFTVDTNANTITEFEWMQPSYHKYLYVEYQDWHLSESDLKSDSGDIFLSEDKFNRLAK